MVARMDSMAILSCPTRRLWRVRVFWVSTRTHAGPRGMGNPSPAPWYKIWGGRDFEDLMAGVDEIVHLRWADPERIGVTGYSYGGFMTNWAITQTGRFRAAVSGACISDLSSLFGTSDIGTNLGLKQIGGTPQEMPELFLAHSPAYAATKVTTPLLLLHWEGDMRCPIAQSEEMFVGLKALGKATEFVRYPNGYHSSAFHSPSQQVDRMYRTANWLRRYLAGE
ncbi:MAG: S9 family peptidase [Dehalococcoidia bacterium]|nr:S9 family peptidase [Dehalococcoidia bacterium]